MRDIKPPIFVFAEGTGGAYRSIGAAAAHLEPWYVEEYAPSVFDSEGRKIEVTSECPAQLQLSSDPSSGREEFMQLIADVIHARVDEWTQSGKVSKLVDAFLKY